MRRSLLFYLLPLLLLAACRKVPDHARLIPRTALSVVGLNTGNLTRKVAWPALLGADVSSSFDSFARHKGYNIRVEALQRSGLDLSSTLYVYMMPSGNSRNRMASPEAVAILPLENSGKWSQFLQESFPKMQPLTVAGGQAAQLDDNLAILWTDKVAFLRAPVRGAGSYVLLPDSTEAWQDGKPDPTATQAALEALPKISKEAALTGDDRFSLLTRSNRDVIAWLNYENMFGTAGGMAPALRMMNSKIYKDMAMTATANFNDGEIEAEIWYYTSEALSAAGRKMGSGSVPKEMIARLPKDNLDGFGAGHLSLEALRLLLEQTGLTGIVNMGLAAQQLSLDDITGALTGDFTVSVSNYKTVAVPPVDSLYGPFNQSRPTMDYVVALRLGKQEKVARLLQFLLSRKLLEQAGPNLYVPFGNSAEGGVLLLDRQYAVAARTQQQAQDYLAATAKRELPTNAKAAVGMGPMALYVDFQQIMSGLDTTLMSQRRDRLQWLESQRVFSHLIISGGSFNSDHLSYTTRLKLLNQTENALLQLLRYANRITEIEHAYPVIYSPEVHPAPNAAL